MFVIVVEFLPILDLLLMREQLKRLLTTLFIHVAVVLHGKAVFVRAVGIVLHGGIRQRA